MIQLYPAIFEAPQARQDARGSLLRGSASRPCPATAESVRRARIALRRVTQDESHAQLGQLLIRRQAQSAIRSRKSTASLWNEEEGSRAAVIFSLR
jgi:hypothetical protein